MNPLSYQDIRDRLMSHALAMSLRVDWIESTRTQRVVLLWDREQVVQGRSVVPLFPDKTPSLVAVLERDLRHLFGEGWLTS